jgi:asparagine synthase (glutamine-hydrolysing)
MCGILGLVGDPGAVTLIGERFSDALNLLVHRGPDAGRVDRAPGALLGHRRLSIIDIEGGAQPMESASGRFTLTYNGEVYNFRDLAAAHLQALALRTRSDTEVVLEVLERHGIAGLSKLRGMFALALYDHGQREVLLARDPLGIKPLYYAELEGCLAFASEIEPLRHLLASVTPSESAMVSYLRYAYVPEPDTIYREIRAVEPGRWLRYGPSGLQTGVYWRPTLATADEDGDLVDTLLEHLRESADLRLISDVPVASLLSGGVDSALIAAVLQDRLTYFNLAFGETYDESDRTRATAEHFGVQLEVVDAEMALPRAQYETLARRVGQPFGDTSLFACDRVFERVARSHKVCLSADGADEVFAGYNMRRAIALDRLASPLKWIGGRRGRDLMEAGLLQILRGYLDWTGISLEENVDPDVLAAWEDPYWQRVVDEVRIALEQTRDLTNIVSWVLLRLNLPNDMLVKVDRASMTHSLEVRVPFLDHKIVEWGLRLPSRAKQDLRRAKKPLKDALRRKGIPSSFLDAPKAGFGPDPATWATRLSDYTPAAGGFVESVLRPEARVGLSDNVYLRLAGLWEATQ